MTHLMRRAMLHGLLAATVCGVGGTPARAANEATATIRLPADVTRAERATIKAIDTTQKVVAMTFDDGPHPRLTPKLLDLLKARGIRATFYLIGNRVVAHPHLVQRMVNEGHEVGNHTWSHPYLTDHAPDAVLQELDRTARAVYTATGKQPVTMRPPYGAMTAQQRRMVLARRHLPTILWSVDPQDWRRPEPSVVTERILSAAMPGGIVLNHDIHPETIRAMPNTLDGLSARGFRFVTISEMLGWPRWHNRTFGFAYGP